MENKQHNRQSSVPPKGPASDGRKDNGNNPKHHRNQRRRDPAPRPRNEPAPGRKPAPQRSREFDKRPRSRGYFNDNPRQEVTQERRAEQGSALRPGSKKGNLNHLLNFTYTSRESDGIGRGGGGHSSSNLGWKGKNRYVGKTTVKYNKERFLQANCQFVVREDADYSTHAADPDTLVDWSRIEQVRIFSHEVPSCPICLYPPTAAKITRCGHIYCWPCILHYLSLEDNKSWRKCPICYESIHKKDLKSVMALERHQFGVGEQITMKLMKRMRGTTYAMPRLQWTDRCGKPHNVEDTVDLGHTKLLTASFDQVKRIVDAERIELERQLKEEGDTLEGSFVQAALQLHLAREEHLRTSMGVKEEITQAIAAQKIDRCSTSSTDEELEKPAVYQKNQDVVQYADAFCDEIGSSEDGASATCIDTEEDVDDNKDVTGDDMKPKQDSDLELNCHATTKNDVEEGLSISVDDAAEKLDIVQEKKSSGNHVTDIYYYYQAQDGQHIYLHSINARCMLKEYGNWENCPETITATIVEMEGVSMTEELRRRLRYLSHLPVTCEFQVAEIAIKPPVVSTETLCAFSDEIQKRHRLRQRKSREERQRSKKIRIDEDKKIGIYPGMRVSISSQRHFPDASYTPLHVSKSAPILRAESPAESNASSTGTPFGSPPGLNPNAGEFSPGSPASVSSLDDGQQSSSMSFAEMLRAGKAKQQTEVWPKCDKLAEQVKTVKSKTNADSDQSDEEDRVPIPVFQSSFGDAIEQALNKFKSLDLDAEEAVVSTGVSSVGSKKKKGRKKQLLFTTTMKRN